MKNLLKKFSFFNDINLILFERKWRKKNGHNHTNVYKKFNIDKVKVGRGTYGDLCIYNFGNKEEFLEIGNFCSIGPEVKFLLSGEHDYNMISTYPFKKEILNETESRSKGKIIVKDDVWIGFGTIILSGVTIGQGAIIGAGSIVAKNVPDYSIFVNNQVIKYRFSKRIIDKLLKIDFSKITNYNLDILYQNITEENIDDIIKKVKEECYGKD